MDKEKMFSKKRILLEDVRDKSSMIDAMCLTLFEDDMLVDIERYKSDIYAREKEYSTYVGHGIAIPHAISNAVKSAGICYMKPDKGIVYGEEDEVANLIFMLAVPTDSNVHLKMLSAISAKLMHKEIRHKLLEAKNVDETYAVLQEII